MMAAGESTAAQMAEALHALCQPLTALQCRLEVGRLQEQARALRGPGRADDADPAVWSECLAECRRLNATVAAMRALVQQATKEMLGRAG